ncbi:MAG TPA: hypothetical protein VNR61_20595 [Niallia sp.]|nr:hypothetical protein [Niallia sp.]
MLRTKKVFILGIVFFLAFLFITEEAIAATDSSISITTEAGLDGKVVDGKAFLLKVTLENSGKDFKGDLLIPFSPSYETGGYNVVNVDIPANSKKTYSVTVPGISSDSNYTNNKMKLYEGKWQDGKSVTFLGKKEVTIQLITEYTLGILSDHYDQFKELRKIPSYSIHTTEITKDDLPDNDTALDTLSFLLVDQFALSDLSESQQQALKKWIQNGGVLLTSGTKNGKQAYGNLETDMPLSLGDEKESMSVTALQNSKEEFQLESFQSKLTKQAEAISIHNNQPILGVTSLGEGKIIQSSFSLSDNKLVNWQEYSRWIGNVLLTNTNEQLVNSQYGGNPLNNLYYGFAESNEYFKSSAISLGTLLLILAIYLIIIVPILYFGLKKMDKREHAWWIIPVISIVLSVGMFISGAKDRIGNVQFNEMGIYQFKNQQLNGYQATTLLSNKSGDFTLTYDKADYHLLPYKTDGSLMKDAVIKEKRKSNEIIFPSVEYWSSRTMFGTSSLTQKEGFTHKFTLTEDKISGELTNHFPYSFYKVFIWSGNEQLDIGAIKAGETKKINITRKEKYFKKPFDSTYGSSGYDYNGKDINEYRELVLKDAINANNLWQGASFGSPLIIGITKDEIVDVRLVEGKAKKNITNMILQPLNVTNHFPGKLTLQEDDLDQDIEIINGKIYSMNFANDDLMVEDGEYIYSLSVPDSYQSEKLSFDSLTILPVTNLGLKLSVYNHKNKEYETFNTNFTANKEKVEAYFDGNKQIKIKVEKATNGDPYLQLPTVKIKGEIKE